MHFNQHFIISLNIILKNLSFLHPGCKQVQSRDSISSLRHEILSPSLHSFISVSTLLNVWTVPSHTEPRHHRHYQ